MNYSSEIAITRPTFPLSSVKFLLLVAAIQLFCVCLYAHPEISTSEDQTTVTINDAPEQEVYVIGKSVIVKKSAKGVLAVGGDVTVEGRIEGDSRLVRGDARR